MSVANIIDALDRQLQNLKRQIPQVHVPPVLPSVSGDIIKKISRSAKLRPFTRDNVLYYYFPLQGLFSYGALSVTVMNPHLMTRIFPNRDITNILLLSAGTGAGLWLWSRPHMAAAPPARRFSWVFLGSSLWTLGSILLWAILRSTVSRKPTVGTVLGILSGGVLTHAAMDYFYYLEVMFCGEVHLPDEIYEPHSDDEKYDIDI